jgi:hypothetical protein
VALGRLASLALLSVLTPGCDGCSCAEAEQIHEADLEIVEDVITADVAAAAELGFEVLGLRLGASDADVVRAWLAALGIPCSEGTDQERSLLVTECRDIDGPALFGLRPFGGDVARVILEQRFDSTVVSVSIRRRHPAVASGQADYGPTCEAIVAQLGPGSVSGGFDVAPESTEPSREITAWSNERIAVDVEVLRGMGPAVMVTETWRWHGEP